MKHQTIEENKNYTKEEIKKFKSEALIMLEFENKNLLKKIEDFGSELEPLFNNNNIVKKELLEEIKSCFNKTLYDKINNNINNFKEKVIIKQNKNEIFNNINYIINNINKFKVNTNDFFSLNEKDINDDFFVLFDDTTILLLSIYHLNKILYDNI